MRCYFLRWAFFFSFFFFSPGFVLCAVSDQNEEALFLRSQLYSIFRLLLLVFGPHALQRKQSPYFLRHKQQIQRLVDLSSFYFTHNQSFLVRAAEQVDVNRDLLKHCRLELQKILKTLPHASHAILYVGTKVLAIYNKPEWGHIYPQDLFLLLLYSRAEYHPIERTVVMDDVPVADYTDHAGAAAKEEVRRQEGLIIFLFYFYFGLLGIGRGY
jgi:hypothetical protein